jgi:hypothetical protein
MGGFGSEQKGREEERRRRRMRRKRTCGAVCSFHGDGLTSLARSLFLWSLMAPTRAPSERRQSILTARPPRRRIPTVHRDAHATAVDLKGRAASPPFHRDARLTAVDLKGRGASPPSIVTLASPPSVNLDGASPDGASPPSIVTLASPPSI